MRFHEQTIQQTRKEKTRAIMKENKETKKRKLNTKKTKKRKESEPLEAPENDMS